MEINVTQIVNEDVSQFANSVHESGLSNIGQITWDNAVEYASKIDLIAPEQQGELRDWIEDFGAWSKLDVEEMTNIETVALLIQFIAGDVREMESFETYEDYEKEAVQGAISGRLYRGDNGQFYFYVGI